MAKEGSQLKTGLNCMTPDGFDAALRHRACPVHRGLCDPKDQECLCYGTESHIWPIIRMSPNAHCSSLMGDKTGVHCHPDPCHLFPRLCPVWEGTHQKLHHHKEHLLKAKLSTLPCELEHMADRTLLCGSSSRLGRGPAVFTRQGNRLRPYFLRKDEARAPNSKHGTELQPLVQTPEVISVSGKRSS